ncbi:MAG: stage II sporulation protein R [Clostridia bacterium]|nr:stage II sporulation protein R [Clostridia bacterium]
MEKRILIATIVLCSVLLLVGILPVHGEERIYDNVVRLHVLANSDSEEDQALKLKVRDAILAETAPLLQDCTSREEACRRLEEQIPRIRQVAEQTLIDEGHPAPVSVLLGEEEYPRRNYDSVCFPSGEYLSLRVCIGEAEGQNWWCCLFPPICLGSATVSADQAEDAFISVGMTPSQYKIITETEKPVYKVRFKLL